jgi:hypothetical protein
MEKNRFYIRDCCGKIVGNPKGYRTMRGAMQQADSRKSKIHWELRDRFNMWHDRNPSEYLVYSIVLHD